jgi:hypothetical protein
LLPHPLGPSPNSSRVGVHKFPFEACSGFTRVTARRIAQPPNGGLCHEASTRTVTRPSRSSATRSTDNSLGGTSLPDLIGAARTQPGNLTVATSVGGVLHRWSGPPSLLPLRAGGSRDCVRPARLTQCSRADSVLPPNFNSHDFSIGVHGPTSRARRRRFRRHPLLPGQRTRSVWRPPFPVTGQCGLTLDKKSI